MFSRVEPRGLQKRGEFIEDNNSSVDLLPTLYANYHGSVLRVSLPSASVAMATAEVLPPEQRKGGTTWIEEKMNTERSTKSRFNSDSPSTPYEVHLARLLSTKSLPGCSGWVYLNLSPTNPVPDSVDRFQELQTYGVPSN